MASDRLEPELRQRLAQARVADVGVLLQTRIGELTRALVSVHRDRIQELRDAPPLRDMLEASTASVLATTGHVLRYGIAAQDVAAPSAAQEYARRAAQHGISANALVRVYRLGQAYLVDWGFERIAAVEPDPRVALTAAQLLTATTFEVVDTIHRQVAREYESERERWLAHRRSVRAEMLARVLAGEAVEPAAADSALGYRLRRRHLGAVVWTTEPSAAGDDTVRLEQLVAEVGAAVGSSGQPLFVPQDRVTGWVWLPLGPDPAGPTGQPADRPIEQPAEQLAERLGDLLAEADPAARLALGLPGTDLAGFCATHDQALRAHHVATVARGRDRRVSSYGDEQLRAAGLLALDPELARELVARALGDLAADTDAADRLRETLLTFLSERGSYLATATRLHLHKNTVKYRVDRAIARRGRPVDADRVELELALIACRWLGGAVLIPE